MIALECLHGVQTMTPELKIIQVLLKELTKIKQQRKEQ